MALSVSMFCLSGEMVSTVFLQQEGPKFESTCLGLLCLLSCYPELHKKIKGWIFLL